MVEIAEAVEAAVASEEKEAAVAEEEMMTAAEEEEKKVALSLKAEDVTVVNLAVLTPEKDVVPKEREISFS